MDAHYRSFEKLVLPELVKQKIGVLGMKRMANGIILKSKTVTAIECLHYALNLPTSVVITGCDSMEILDQALEAARTFRPMGEAEVQALLAKTAKAAATGEFELFKTTSIFDHRGQPGMAGRGVQGGGGGDSRRGAGYEAASTCPASGPRAHHAAHSEAAVVAERGPPAA